MLTTILFFSLNVSLPLITSKSFEEYYGRMEKIDAMILSSAGIINYTVMEQVLFNIASTRILKEIYINPKGFLGQKSTCTSA